MHGSGFDPSIRRHSGICGAADDAVLNIVRTKRKKSPQKIFKKRRKKSLIKLLTLSSVPKLLPLHSINEQA
jgi:hypothetical protein